jgi:hypothetical protein
MNLYLLTQTDNNGYDTYDSMVIAASSEEDAKHLSFIQCAAYTEGCNPDYTTVEPVWRNYYPYNYQYAFDNWHKHPTITLLATNALVEEGIVCASFNAG